MERPGRIQGKIRLWVLLLLFFILPSITVKAAHVDYESDDLYQIMEKAVVWKKSQAGVKSGDLFQKEFLDLAGTSAGDWYALSLGRMGVEDDYFSYLSRLKFAVTNAYKTENRLSDQKATEWHRIALTILSLGGDPTSFGEDLDGKPINLIKDGTYDRLTTASLGAQGINGYIFGLITLDALGYMVPETYPMDRQAIIQKILENQQIGGGFSLDGHEPGIDLTAMALTALAPYQYLQNPFSVQGQEKTVGEAIKLGISYLSENQSFEGDFASFGSYNLESSAQVLVALTSLGIDPINDERFLKNGHNVLDGLMKYQNKEGSFLHNLEARDSSVDKTTSNAMATEQALYSLVSLYRYQGGLRGLYDFRPEMPNSLKEQIKSLEKGIEILDNQSLLEVKELARIYGEIPRTERMRIKGLDLFYSRLEELSISYDPILLKDFNENTMGEGAVISLKNFQPVTSVLRFNQSDEEALLTLEKDYGIEDLARLLTLNEKLEKAENRNDFPKAKGEIEMMLQVLTQRKRDMEALNEEILEKAYPFYHLGKEDLALVEDLLFQINKLRDEEKTLVLGYEDLILAKTRINADHRRRLILGIGSGTLLILLAILGKQIYKKKKKKQENKMPVEELDW